MKQLLTPVILSFLFFITCLSSNKCLAQQDLILHNIPLVPQASYTNPAITPTANFYLGVPGISSLYFNAYNTGFKWSNLITHRAQDDSLVLDTETFLKKLAKKNYLSTALQVDILTFGFRVKKNYFSLNIIEKEYMRFTYPGDFFKLAIEGQGLSTQLIGKTADFSGLGFDASLYTEFGLGYARDFSDKLTIGLKAKYLQGQVNITTAKSEIGLTTDATTFDLTGKSTIRVNTSGTDTLFRGMAFDDWLYGMLPGVNIGYGGITTFNPMDIFKKDNRGIALDLGGNYQINDKFSVSGSVIDLGYINWKEQLKNYTTDNSSFTYEGFDIRNFINAHGDTNTTSIKTYFDSLLNSFKPVETNEAYKSWLNSKIYLTGNFYLNKNNNVGLTMYNEFYHGMHTSVALSFSTRVKKGLHATVNYSVLHRSWNNMGAGLVLNLKGFEWYVTSDNFLGPIFPQHTKNFNIHTGFNILVGYKDKKRAPKDSDKDGVADKEDDCPDIKGELRFKGCPDTDGDGLPDQEDKCPYVAGPKENGGCPWGDKDHDSVFDNVDKCPDVAGSAENDGCPWGDRDNDSILDNIDKCPELAGPKENHGCPWGDRDYDSIPDNIDKCPDVFGAKDNNGCPWGDKDKDGVADNIDKCPEVAGLTTNFGCPEDDMDKDGIIDKLDSCPKTPGPVSNHGCPIIEKAEKEILKTAFSNLEFESGKDIIKVVSYSSLEELAKLLVRKPTWKLKLAGHTDNVGKVDANMTLSRKRAEAVKNFLVIVGIESERIMTEYYGPNKPIADNKTPEGRAKNRRVEMNIVFE